MGTDKELEKNKRAYSELIDTLEREHLGRFALFHNGRFVYSYKSRSDAYKIGREKFKLGNFSLKQVGEIPSSQGLETLSLNAVIGE